MVFVLSLFIEQNKWPIYHEGFKTHDKCFSKFMLSKPVIWEHMLCSFLLENQQAVKLKRAVEFLSLLMLLTESQLCNTKAIFLACFHFFMIMYDCNEVLMPHAT